MKKLSVFVLVAGLLLVGNVTYAQIKLGPKIGVNLAEMSIKSKGISFDPTTMTGFHIGVVAEITMKNNYYLQPGIFYSTKGSKYQIGTLEMSISPNYIEIPINTLWKIHLKGMARLLLYTGPYFAVGIGGTYKVNGESGDINFGTSDNDDLKPFDSGMNFGVGLEVSSFQITAQYSFGFSDLNPNSTTDATMKMGVLSFSMSYLIGK